MYESVPFCSIALVVISSFSFTLIISVACAFGEVTCESCDVGHHLLESHTVLSSISLHPMTLSSSSCALTKALRYLWAFAREASANGRWDSLSTLVRTRFAKS